MLSTARRPRKPIRPMRPRGIPTSMPGDAVNTKNVANYMLRPGGSAETKGSRTTKIAMSAQDLRIRLMYVVKKHAHQGDGLMIYEKIDAILGRQFGVR